MIEISKYNNYLETTVFQPNNTRTQVTNNLTSNGSLLIAIDMLKENECLVIRKLPEEKIFK